MKIGIIVAMDKELRQLQNLFDCPDVKVVKCGIGKVNAALGTAELIKSFHPDAIISSGCAGGNGDGVHIQDIVVSTEVGYHDVYCGEAIDNETIYGQVQGMPARYQADERLLRKAQEISDTLATPSSIHQGLIVTGDWFVDTKEKMRQIVSLFPEAKAVDMESAAIAQTCFINHIPFISFRIISDLPLCDSKAAQYHDFWNTIADRSFQTTKLFVEKVRNKK